MIPSMKKPSDQYRRRNPYRFYRLCGIYKCINCKGFVESTALADYSGVVAACIGKQTKAAADAYGMQTYVAEKATIEALIDLVVKIKNK